MVAGSFTAILLTLFIGFTEPRRRRIEVNSALSDLPKIQKFLEDFASRNGWDEAMANRFTAVSEETLLSFLQSDGLEGDGPKSEEEEEQSERRLLLTAHKEDGVAVLEYIAATGDENLQDQIALLSERIEDVPNEREVSLRLLRHLASSVLHQQYHGTDIVTVRVDPPKPTPRPNPGQQSAG